MLTMLRLATEYNLAKSPMMIKLQTDDLWYNTDIGIKAYSGQSWSGNPAVNSTFVIKWFTGIVTFTFRASLINNTSIRTNFSALSSTIYTQQVVADILLNPTIAALFDVTNNGTDILIRAKTPGPIYNFLNGSSSSYSSFYIYQTGTNNIITQQHSNYGVLVEAYMYDTFTASTFKRIFSTLKKYSTDLPVPSQTLEFDISEIINAYLQYDIPQANSGSTFLCENVLKRFFLRLQVKYGDPPITVFTGYTPAGFINSIAWPPSSGYSVDGFALKGGFSKQKARLLDKEQFQNYYHLNKSFLTRQPRIKKITRLQPEYLYFILPNDYPGQNLCINITSYDAAGKVQATVLQSMTTGSLVKNSCFCFPINFYLGFISLDKAPQYRAFVANVLSPNVPLSEAFTYYIDGDKYIDEKIIMFSNSDGGFDTFRATGQVIKNGEYEREEYNKTFFLYDPAENGDLRSEFGLEKTLFKVQSGWITKEQSEWLADIFLADIIVEYDQNNQTYIPIVIKTKSFEKDKSQQTIRGFSFEYTHAYQSPVNDFLNYL